MRPKSGFFFPAASGADSKETFKVNRPPLAPTGKQKNGETCLAPPIHKPPEPLPVTPFFIPWDETKIRFLLSTMKDDEPSDSTESHTDSLMTADTASKREAVALPPLNNSSRPTSGLGKNHGRLKIWLGLEKPTSVLAPSRNGCLWRRKGSDASR
jgi:hypothetical protein